MWIAFDIETIPNKRAETYFSKVKKYRAPSNYTDPEKIVQYIHKQKEKDLMKAGLYWFTGQVICISVESTTNNKVKTFYGQDEKKLLTEFLEFLSKQNSNKKLIGKSGKDFDHPFIKGRILHHDLGFVDIIRDTNIRDVDEIFSHSRSCSQVSNLNAYAFGMDMELKGFDGSMVHEMWLEDRHEEIKSYCAYDTHVVAEMLRRYMKDFKSGEIAN